MPQDALETTLLTRAATPARGTEYKAPDLRGPNYPTEADTYHPKDTKEGVIEWLVKTIGHKTDRIIPEDFPFLEQYFHPDKDILPKTDLRPTKATPQNMEYRTIPDEWFDRAITRRNPKNGKPITQLQKKDKFGYTNLSDGLGHYTSSETPEYKSIYDVWDFNSPFDNTYADTRIINDVISAIMKRVGKPFVIYNRIPKDNPKSTDLYTAWGKDNKKF